MARRNPIKPLNQTAEQVATAAAAEKTRKAESRRALAAARKAEKAAGCTPIRVGQNRLDRAAAYAAAEPAPAPRDHAAEYAANAIKAATEDAAATGMTVEAILADMGLDVTGRPVKPADEKTRYAGPMLALVAARKVYVKGANGNPHCNDRVANAFASLTREQVLSVCIRAMKLEGNPYLHLNPGQQSMNLRNKLRGQMKNGFVTEGEILALVAACKA